MENTDEYDKLFSLIRQESTQSFLAVGRKITFTKFNLNGIVRYFKSDDLLLRVGAAHLLAGFDSKGIDPLVLIPFLDSKHPDVRENVAGLLMHHFDFYPVKNTVLKCSKVGNPDVRDVASLRFLRDFKDDVNIETLFIFLKSGHPQVVKKSVKLVDNVYVNEDDYHNLVNWLNSAYPPVRKVAKKLLRSRFSFDYKKKQSDLSFFDKMKLNLLVFCSNALFFTKFVRPILMKKFKEDVDWETILFFFDSEMDEDLEKEAFSVLNGFDAGNLEYEKLLEISQSIFSEVRELAIMLLHKFLPMDDEISERGKEIIALF